VHVLSPCGAIEGRLKSAPIRAGNLEVYWPEGNILLSGSAIDPDSMEADAAWRLLKRNRAGGAALENDRTMLFGAEIQVRLEL
jgi:hypothetical protein